MTKLKWILGGAVAIVIVGLGVVYLNLNAIVRRTVERQATASLDVPTAVGGASVSLFGGSVALSEIRIGSPQGFEAPGMVSLAGIRVAASLGQLRSEPARIQQIVVDRPQLVVEQSGGRFNFKVLMDQQPSSTPGERPMRLIIGELSVNDAVVVLRPGVPGLTQEIVVPIPSFTLTEIGTAEDAQNGAAIKEVVMLLVTTMASRAAESEKLPPELQLLLKGDIESVARDMASRYGGQAVEELRKNLPPEVGGAIGEMIEGARNGEKPGEAIEKGLRGLIDQKGRRDKPATQPR
jgi:hypothetical protein